MQRTQATSDCQRCDCGSGEKTEQADTIQEEQAIKLLKQSDLKASVLEAIGRDAKLSKSRKVLFALLERPCLPRHLATSLLRGLHTFELMKVAVQPAGFSAEIKVLADDILLSRLESITLGEKRTLARRGSARIAGEMLGEPDAGVVGCALDNPRLTEASIVKALNRGSAPVELAQAVRRHPKWGLRREIRGAMMQEQPPSGEPPALTDQESRE